MRIGSRNANISHAQFRSAAQTLGTCIFVRPKTMLFVHNRLIHCTEIINIYGKETFSHLERLVSILLTTDFTRSLSKRKTKFFRLFIVLILQEERQICCKIRISLFNNICSFNLIQLFAYFFLTSIANIFVKAIIKFVYPELFAIDEILYFLF